MWKILTAQIGKENYCSLISSGLFPDKQKGCHMGTRGKGELIYINLDIPKGSKRRLKNVVMASIDYKKAHDVALQKWKTECFKMYEICNEVIKCEWKELS